MKIRTCMVTNMYPTTERPSYGAFIKSQIDSIVAAGHDTEVFFVDGRTSRWNYVRSIPALRKLLRDKPFDLVHAHYGLSGLVTAFQFTHPVVLSFCGDDLLGTSDGSGGITRGSRMVVWLDQWIARGVARIIVKSRQMLDALGSSQARNKAVVIPNGVSFELFKPMNREDARRELNLDAERPYVLFPSTPLAGVKRVDLAEAAVALVKENDPNVEMIVLHGKAQNTVPLYMSECDAMLLTSDSEGSPNVVKEAMACNLPVVSVDAGDAWEVIAGTRQCFAVERHPDNIATKLAAVLQAGDRSDGRDRVRHLELGAVAERVIAVYESVLAERG